MAVLSALDKLLANPKTAKFAETLDYETLPKGWAKDKEIQRLADQAYYYMGEGSPFFRAWKKQLGDDANEGWENAGKGYHGSRKKFSSFNTQKGRGADPELRDAVRSPIFVSPDREFAEEYAEAYANGSGKPVMYNGYIAAKNTFDFENPKHLAKIEDKIHRATMENVKEGNWRTIEGPEVQQAIKDAGFDSYRTSEFTSKNMAFFDPAQFKSVENNGLFNPFDKNMYKGLLGAVGAGGAASALGAGEANAGEMPLQYIPGAEIAEQIARNAPITYTVDPWHSLSVGARAVTEGVLGAPSALVNQVISPFTDYRFGNPGEYVADWMGQAKPVTDGEKLASDIVYGASEALPYIATGTGLAKYGQGVTKGVGKSLADGPKTQAALGALLGMFGHDDE